MSTYIFLYYERNWSAGVKLKLSTKIGITLSWENFKPHVLWHWFQRTTFFFYNMFHFTLGIFLQNIVIDPAFVISPSNIMVFTMWTICGISHLNLSSKYISTILLNIFWMFTSVKFFESFEWLVAHMYYKITYQHCVDTMWNATSSLCGKIVKLKEEN